MTLDEQARALYERNAPIAPKWDQLGETTKDTWREDVQARIAAGTLPDLQPVAPQVRTRVRTR